MEKVQTYWVTKTVTWVFTAPVGLDDDDVLDHMPDEDDDHARSLEYEVGRMNDADT